jgi:hypothetical protein
MFFVQIFMTIGHYMYKKTFFILALMLSLNTCALLINGCSKNGRITYCVVHRDPSLIPYDTTGSRLVPPDTSGIFYSSLVLMLRFRDSTHTCMKNGVRGFGNMAYAIMPVTDKYTPIDSLSLTSNLDFDSIHPAGTELKYLFGIPDTFLNHGIYNPVNSFYLMRPPTYQGTHIFTIKIYNHGSNSPMIAVSTAVKLLL